MSHEVILVGKSVYVESSDSDAPVVCLVPRWHPKTDAAERALVEWSDVQIRGRDATYSGYSDKSNITLVTDQGRRVGGQGSKPLISGRMGADRVDVVERALTANLSPRQREACIVIFAPGPGSDRVRAAASGYSYPRYRVIKKQVLTMISMLNL